MNSEDKENKQGFKENEQENSNAQKDNKKTNQ